MGLCENDKEGRNAHADKKCSLNVEDAEKI